MIVLLSVTEGGGQVAADPNVAGKKKILDQWIRQPDGVNCVW